MDYVIEPARSDDLAKLAQVEIAANALFAGRGLAGVVANDSTSLDELAHAQAAGLLWVAREPAGEPVGFALLELVDGQAHLEEIDVDPAHGRRGVGRALLDAVVAWARSAGLRAITLTTFRDVPWNAPFYARAGFRVLAPHELGRASRRWCATRPRAASIRPSGWPCGATLPAGGSPVRECYSQRGETT